MTLPHGVSQSITFLYHAVVFVSQSLIYQHFHTMHVNFAEVTHNTYQPQASLPSVNIINVQVHSYELHTFPIIFVMSACMKQLGPQRMNFHYTFYCGVLLKSIKAIYFWFKLNKKTDTLHEDSNEIVESISLSLLLHYENTLGLLWQ